MKNQSQKTRTVFSRRRNQIPYQPYKKESMGFKELSAFSGFYKEEIEKYIKKRKVKEIQTLVYQKTFLLGQQEDLFKIHIFKDNKLVENLSYDSLAIAKKAYQDMIKKHSALHFSPNEEELRNYHLTTDNSNF